MSLKIPHSENTIPIVGFGSGTKWQWKKKASPETALSVSNPTNTDPDLVNSIITALETGFKHIDTAEFYTTRPDVGLAVKTYLSKHPEKSRSDLFITDKYHANPPNITISSDTEIRGPYKSLKEGLKLLNLNYVDLFLLHTVDLPKGLTLIDAWNEMIKLKNEGLCKNIGVSNFDIENLKIILNNCAFPPQILQIEVHPYLQNQSPEIRDFCIKNNILIEAYGPLVPITKCKEGPIIPILAKLAKKYNLSDSQILIKWIQSQKIVSITTTSNIERMKQILNVQNISIDQSDLDEITIAGKSFFFRAYPIPPLPQYDDQLKQKLHN